jgi:hypothetical protein
MKVLLAILLVMAHVLDAGASSQELFDQANKSFEQGRYKEAVAAYQKMITGGIVSPALYFNLANASYRAGEIGRSLYYNSLARSPSTNGPSWPWSHSGFGSDF